MSGQKDTVQRYFKGFRLSDHPAVLACLTDDVVWDLPGYKTLAGKDAFDQEIEGDGFEARPQLEVDRLVEEGSTVVATGTGAGFRDDGTPHRFAYCTIFTFVGPLIGRVESFVVPLT